MYKYPNIQKYLNSDIQPAVPGVRFFYIVYLKSVNKYLIVHTLIHVV